MTYILSKDLPDPMSLGYEKRRKEQWAAYQRRLNKLKKKSLPASALEFTLADWHYNNIDPRCPHDAWLEHVIIREPSSGERSEIRGLEIEIKLLGAYHDGYIQLLYKDVESYFFDQPYRWNEKHSTENGHGDWLIDDHLAQLAHDQEGNHACNAIPQQHGRAGHLDRLGDTQEQACTNRPAQRDQLDMAALESPLQFTHRLFSL